jgi:Membrane-associated lipoprotein involved in thiamine biosynthesis
MRNLCVLLLALLSLSMTQKPQWLRIQLNGTAQGTTYHITYYAPDSLVTQKQIDSILIRIDNSLSIYKPQSLISRFNQSTIGITMDSHLKNVIRQSLQTCRQTNGIFDITLLPLVQAWGFGPTKNGQLPDSNTIKKLKSCVNSNYLRIKGNRLLKRKPCVQIDVNGIAQGYSVDVLAGFLEQQGVQHYLVELGGEIRVKGHKQPGNEKMKIGIEAPSDDLFEPSMMQKILVLDQGAITTSGSYRKFHESDGKKITHIIDPRTGYPTQNELISVTVYARDAMTADAFDNALMVMGLKNALHWVEQRKDLAAHFIYRTPDGAVADTASASFYKLLQR